MEFWQLLLIVFLGSLALSSYSWKARAAWPLQLVAAAMNFAISYPLIFGGLGFLTIAIGLGQLALAVILYRYTRTTRRR